MDIKINPHYVPLSTGERGAYHRMQFNKMPTIKGINRSVAIAQFWFQNYTSLGILPCFKFSYKGIPWARREGGLFTILSSTVGTYYGIEN